jgi:transglutaminase-like putative cysteine protease
VFVRKLNSMKIYAPMKSSWLLAATFAGVLLCGRAAEAGAYEGPRWQFLDAKKAVAAAAEITSAKYPDSDEATIEKKMVRVYRADGTGECQDETFVKVLTEKGKRNNRSLSLYYMLPYSTAEATKIEVIKPGGEATAVDIAANSKEMIDDSQMGANIYDPNSKILRVNIPNVEIGDVVHSVTRTTVQRPVIPGEFADDNVFEGPGYIRHMTYEVYAPDDKPLKRIALRDEVAGTVKHSRQSDNNNTTLHRWEITDVPRMFDEPGMPPYDMVLQRLMVSTTHSWEDVSKWYYNVCKPHLEATSPEMKNTVAELLVGAKTEREKIEAVFYHVSKKIRYMGLTPEKDRPGFEPHDVKLTFGNKYGVCRDKAALLVAMLQAAGFDAYPVLVNVGSKRDPEVPEPNFNHAIVGVELKKGEHILMDPTAENTKELLPSYECDQSYLLCRPDGDTLRTSPIIPPEDNMMRIKTTATLNAAGTLEAKSELAFEGINDNQYREAFSRMKPDDKQRFFERNLKRSMPGARLKSLKLIPDDMLDVSTNLHAELEFAVDGMTAAGDGKAVVNLPWISKGLGIVNFILGGTGLEKRKYPLRTEIACGLREDIAIQLADGFSGAVSMPNYSPVNDDSMSYQRRVEFKDKSLTCVGELKLKTVEFSPAQYLKLKDSLKTMDYDSRKAPVLATSAPALADAGQKKTSSAGPAVESNARILESRKEFEIKDAHTEILKGRYVKQVLNYSGKKNEAEFKLNFNPSCEEARLVRAVVTSAKGQKQEIATNEINVMDASWNASAKRYTGGKILVANLPGVDIGSTIEVEYEVTTKGKPFLTGFETFQTFDDLDKKQVRLTAAPGVKVQTIITGPAGVVKEQKSKSNGAQVFEWQAQNVKALPAEAQLPPEWVYMAGVEYFAGDVKAYLTELHKTFQDRSRISTKAAMLAKEITKDTHTRPEVIKAIRDYVSKSIRAAGPGFTELPLSELSPADTTLSDGYGHMADRAILLHAMLTAAGFKPEFVLASGLPPISGITNVATSFPLPHNFQSPLVKVADGDHVYYLNDTDQYAQLGSTAFDGKLAIALSSQAFEIVRACRDCKDKTETAYTLSLSDSGKTRVGITCEYYGLAYNSKNKYFSELPPEEKNRYYQEIVSDVAQGARPIGDLTTKFDCYPGIEQYTVEIDNYGIVDGRYAYFDLPFLPSLLPVGADSRTLPLYIAHQSERTVRTEIALPPGFPKVDIAPRSARLSVPAGAGQARITSTESNGKRVITHEFETSPAIVSPKDYPAILNVESALGQKSSRVFLLEANQETLKP